jgi:hypothetical protein
VKISPRVPLWRFFAGLSVIAAWSAAMLWIGKTQGPILASAAAVLFTIGVCSLGEWLVHGVLYHRELPGLGFIRDIHHKGHHFALFPPKRYVKEDGYEFMRFRRPYRPWQIADNAADNFLSKWSQILLHFAAGSPLVMLPAWFATGNPTFFIASAVTLGVLAWLIVYLHGIIHTPSNRWIERTRIFCWLDRHHYIHHVDITANMNFMMPICDVLFGTERGWEMTEKEKAKFPHFDEAKPMAKDIPRLRAAHARAVAS